MPSSESNRRTFAKGAIYALGFVSAAIACATILSTSDLQLQLKSICVVLVVSFTILAFRTSKTYSENLGFRAAKDSELPLDDVRRFALNGEHRSNSSSDALREAFELLTSNLAAAVTIIDIETEEFLFCSPYCEALTGYTLEEVKALGQEFFTEILVAEDFERFRRAVEVCALGEDISVRYRIRHKRGLILWVEAHLVPVFSADGEIGSIMSVANDVTASVRFREKVEEQNQDLSDFSYMISHDLKAPIFTIKGMADVLAGDEALTKDATIKDCLEHIVTSCTRLQALIASVVEYSKLSTTAIEEADVELGSVIANCIKDLQGQIAAADANVQVEHEFPAVRGNEVRLYQVFSNLLSNAVKYRNEERPCKVRVSVAESLPGRVTIAVEDNGSGIPESMLDSVFRPYQRAHGGEVEGSGIGLASVKKIVERLGGSVSVTSAHGEGSSFFVTLLKSKPSGRSLPPELARWY